MNFGTQAAQNTAGASASTDYPAPFTAYWGGQRMQMLIRASELTAAGFTAGAVFNGINFPVVSLGTDWPSVISSCQSFMVKFGYTTATTITAFQTLATTVRPAANFTPTVGYNNLLSFSTTPAAWNGTDNVIIETTFSNNITGTSAKSVIQYNSPTTYSSCIQYRADGVTAATAAAGTVVSYTYNARPDFKLMGTQVQAAKRNGYRLQFHLDSNCHLGTPTMRPVSGTDGVGNAIEVDNITWRNGTPWEDKADHARVRACGAHYYYLLGADTRGAGNRA